MFRFKKNLQTLRDLQNRDSEDVNRYEQLLNEEIIGASSPITPTKSTHRKNNSIDSLELKPINTETVFQLEDEEESGKKSQETFENPFEEENLSDPLNFPDHDNDTDNDNELFQIGNVKVSFFSRKWRNELKKIGKSFLQIYSLMLILIILIGSIFYGTLNNRDIYLKKNIFIDIVNDDIEINVMKPLIGLGIEFITKNNELLNSKLNFNYTSSNSLINNNNFKINEVLEKRVLEKKTWASIYINKNATHDLYQNLRNPNDFKFDYSKIISVYYATTRDVKINKMYLIPLLNKIEQLFQNSYDKKIRIPLINEWLNNQEQTDLILNHKNLIFQNLIFNYIDVKPFNDPILEAPMTVGLIMMIIVSFFQYHFFSPLHNIVSSKIKTKQYIYYRMISSQISYLFLALGFTLLFYIFSKERKFFIAYWLITYFAIAAIGGVNENMALILFVTYPPLIGFWLLFWVILNISPSFNLIETLPVFYRYGYALPIYNYLECLKVILLDSWNGIIGRNIGILIIWVVLNNLIFPFTIWFFSYKMSQKLQKD